MAGARPVIADGDGAVFADEYRTGVSYLPGDGRTVRTALDLQMFRRIWQGLPVRERLLSYFNSHLYPVVRLIRKRIGPAEIGDLPVGQWRHLTAQEILALRESVSSSDAQDREEHIEI